MAKQTEEVIGHKIDFVTPAQMVLYNQLIGDTNFPHNYWLLGDKAIIPGRLTESIGLIELDNLRNGTYPHRIVSKMGANPIPVGTAIGFEITSSGFNAYSWWDKKKLNMNMEVTYPGLADFGTVESKIKENDYWVDECSFSDETEIDAVLGGLAAVFKVPERFNKKVFPLELLLGKTSSSLLRLRETDLIFDLPEDETYAYMKFDTKLTPAAYNTPIEKALSFYAKRLSKDNKIKVIKTMVEAYDGEDILYQSTMILGRVKEKDIIR